MAAGTGRRNGNCGDEITIRQLLNHTSGLFDVAMDDDMLRRYSGAGFLTHRFDRCAPEALVRIAVSYSPNTRPGERCVPACSPKRERLRTSTVRSRSRDVP